MIRLIFKLTTVCLFLILLAVTVVNRGIAPHHCGTSLEFRYIDDYRYYVRQYDFNTGVSLSAQDIQDVVNRDSDLSSDGNYRYEIPDDRDHELIIEDTRTGERRLVYTSRHLLRASWSADSKIILVWTYDGMFPLLVTRINIERAEALSSYGFPPLANGQRNASPDRRYLYASFALSVVTGTRGLTFVDTVTGVLTRFRHATTPPYLWSEDSRWVASEFDGTVSIIDPQTGGFHPEFSEAIEGEGFAWHEGALWFSRLNSEGHADIWRANLEDTSIELMIENARLGTISENGAFATIVDAQSRDLAIYDFATEGRFALNMVDKVETHQRLVRYSDNGRCMAILLSHPENLGHHELRIIDLKSYRTIQDRLLTGSFEIYEMNWMEK